MKQVEANLTWLKDGPWLELKVDFSKHFRLMRILAENGKTDFEIFYIAV